MAKRERGEDYKAWAKAYHHAYYLAHKERFKELNAKSRAKFGPAVIAARKRAWVDANRDHVREHHHAIYLQNRDERLEQSRIYRMGHRLERAMGRVGRSGEEGLALWKSQGGLCGITGDPLDPKTAHLDHILPKARGGDNSLLNLRWTTPEANRLKRALLDDELLQLCLKVLRHLQKEEVA